MSHNPFAVVKDFERVVAEYTGAPHVVAVNSCTMALLLAVKWHLLRQMPTIGQVIEMPVKDLIKLTEVDIPKRTYLSVPMSIIHAGGRPTFRDEDWTGCYQLKPLPVFDCARWFTSGLYNAVQIPHGAPWFGKGAMVCTSHHWTKTLGIQQGGCILLDDPEADAWLRRMRFDGRTEGVAPIDDNIREIGMHCYMAPEVAALGLVRMSHIPRHNDPLPNDNYPDLSQLKVFQ